MSARYPDLAGLPVLITGGASGIGEALVRRFADQGALVASLDIAAPRAGSAGAHRVVDLRDIRATQAAIADLAAELGAFRVLVNNAGDDARHGFADLTPEYWDDRITVNLRHQVFCAQAVAPAMAAAGGGAIINLNSISWMFGAAGLVAYTTAKSAVSGFTKSLARELGAERIRVNGIAPGWVLTVKQIARANATDPAKFQSYLDRQCIKEHLDGDDVAALALWLASSEAKRCTGQTFILDGGVV
jgi:NAD(P)-dependent dehydrogenase (short-subunit alcohol dehydrogenase family)